jgi:tetratricopeptide (TPR) repeat protein
VYYRKADLMKESKSNKSDDKHKNRPKIIVQIPRGRLWLFRLIALIVIPIVFFSVLELTLRLFQFGYPSTALIETKINGMKYVHENSAFAYRFFPKSLAREFTPLRFQAEKPDNVFRIFILGGSAAQGTPDPAYSFGRILDVMLQVRYPDSKFEILSLAMAAINSHVVLEIARDCIEYDPDLFIVYMGNNEVVGPYGPATILTPIISNISLLRLGIRLKGSKIYQLITLVLENLHIFKSPYNKWKGMEMFIQNQVRLNDPGLELTYNNFNDNLEALNQIGQENDIKIIYSTVVSNLKDCPPFNSVHRKDIELSEQQKWDEFYTSGSAHEEAGEYRAAIVKYLEAAKIDSQYADLQYKLGRCYWYTDNFTEAGKSYIRAREYDTNRFRADNRINDIIHRTGTALKGITFLADALSEIEQRSSYGIPGNEFLLEHVHLNFKGNYLVARTILNQLEYIFSDVLKDQKIDETVQITDSLCAAYLAYNNYEHHRILELVLNGFIKEPPFTNQLYHSETIEHLEAELDSLKHVIQAQNINYMINTYEDALRKRPADWLLHYKYAGYLADDYVRKYQEAVDQYQFVIKTVPHDPNTYVMRGVVMGKLGRLQESLNDNKLALRMNPTIARAYFNSGLIYQKLNKTKLAVENYEKAVFYEPTHSKAYNNMAFIFSKQGDISKAMAIIDQGLNTTPNDLILNYNKAMYLYQTGRKPEAIEQLRHVIRIAPNEVKIQEKLNEWLREEK